jgi:hypothetical protein
MKVMDVMFKPTNVLIQLKKAWDAVTTTKREGGKKMETYVNEFNYFWALLRDPDRKTLQAMIMLSGARLDKNAMRHVLHNVDFNGMDGETLLGKIRSNLVSVAGEVCRVVCYEDKEKSNPTKGWAKADIVRYVQSLGQKEEAFFARNFRKEGGKQQGFRGCWWCGGSHYKADCEKWKSGEPAEVPQQQYKQYKQWRNSEEGAAMVEVMGEHDLEGCMLFKEEDDGGVKVERRGEEEKKEESFDLGFGEAEWGHEEGKGENRKRYVETRKGDRKRVKMESEKGRYERMREGKERKAHKERSWRRKGRRVSQIHFNVPALDQPLIFK